MFPPSFDALPDERDRVSASADRDENPLILHSWQRCQAHGLADHDPPQQHQGTVSRECSAALPIMLPLVEDLSQFAQGAEDFIVLTDVTGLIIKVVGDSVAQHDARTIGLLSGACWCEACRGTNAIALALIEAFPMVVVGQHHYLAALHPYFSAAAPIYDGLGLPIGTIAVLGRQEHSHPHSLGMVSAAAQAITNQLQTHLWLGNAQESLTELNAILHTLSEGVMLLTRDGVISQINARASTLLHLDARHATGRRLREVLDVPPELARALTRRQELHDEEVVFQVHGNRTACLCTLKVIHTTHQPTKATNLGPADLVVTPSPVGSFVLSLRPLERMQRLVQRMTGAQAQMRFAQIVGNSSAIREVKRLAQIAAASEATVLLRGETGTGKELFAQSIHNGGARADGPFVAINCAAIPRELIISELFGYEGGAFTGADRHGRPGKFELAHGGTLFLDEIGDMPRDLQTTLLRALETHTVMRLGGQHVINIDVRIIAATHKPLEEDVATGAFRLDLFYRLNVFALTIPALRERREDIPALVSMLLRRHSETLGRTMIVTAEALRAIVAFPWPGNVRELENTIERCVYIATDGIIDLDQLPRDLRTAGDDGASRPSTKPLGPTEQHSLRTIQAANEAAIIHEAIERYRGNLEAAAQSLGISRTTLWRRQQRLRAAGLLA